MKREKAKQGIKIAHLEPIAQYIRQGKAIALLATASEDGAYDEETSRQIAWVLLDILHRADKDMLALFDLLGQLRASFSDPAWATPTTLFTGFAFTGIIYFVFCFGMSRYSLFVENRLNAHRRN